MLLEAGLAYAHRGWYVFPLHAPRGGRCSCGRACASPAKHPRTAHGLNDASREETKIRTWWRRWPDANIGIRTGTASGLVVIDIDPSHGGDASLSDLELRFGALPATVTSRTGGKGRHLFFRHPPGINIRNRVQVGGFPGLDARGEGGYVVVPPSRHISGGTYSWESSRAPDQIPLAPLPPWLQTLLSPGDQRAGRRLQPEAWRLLVAEGAAEGARNTSLTSLAGYLLRRRVDPVVVLELLHAWNQARNRPPLSDEEVAHCVESIAEREFRRRQTEDHPAGPHPSETGDSASNARKIP